MNLRGRVAALLEVHEQEPGFLKSSPEPAPTVDHPPLTERPGTTIGRYKLMEQIGEGGMGTVFVAQQERPIRRKVALKVIKPGMDSKAVVARFEAERQALAIMDHSNIAKALDAGTTESGRPYFAMELVKGIPITEYCDKNKLPIPERLELFIQVCQAIQHAHQKGIIHRDIKPSNVLVTLHDGVPVPKVIDFGVAKALHTRLTDRTIYTEHLQIIGTLLYMSPEQAELSGLDVDTRSDVYSLGVLLYELLTGTTPFQKSELDEAAFDEKRRIICEKDPPRLSNRVSSLGETATAIAEHRQTDVRRLHQAMRGDLDWIVAKSLEKDRTRRYETASGFATDLRRFLRNEPVEARAPSTFYRVRKSVRRNRGLAAAVLAIALVMTVGLVGSITGWREAVRRQRQAVENQQQAVRNQQRAQNALRQVQGLLIEQAMLQALTGDSDKFERTLTSARNAGVSPDWLSTLEGCAELHRCHAKKACQLLNDAITVNPDNVSAHALLSVANVWNGDWNNWSIQVEEVLPMKSRPEYKDYDELFLAYAHFYYDHKAAAKRFDDLLSDKPTWIVPHTLRAAAWGHAASIHNNREYAEKALNLYRGPEGLLGENLTVRMLGLGVYMPAMAVLDDEESVFSAKAAQIVRELRKYPEIAIASHMCALYYQMTNDPPGQKEAWDDVLKHGTGFLLEEAIAAMYRLGHEESALAVPQSDIEAIIGKSYILAVSPVRTDQDRAYANYRKLNDEHDTWYVRHKLLQLLLLLGREAEASEACQEWVLTSRGVEHFPHWEGQSIAFVANPSEAEFSFAEDDPVGRFFVNYQRAFLAMSKGELETALEYFTVAAEWHYPDERRQWARAFAVRLSEHLKDQGLQREVPQESRIK